MSFFLSVLTQVLLVNSWPSSVLTGAQLGGDDGPLDKCVSPLNWNLVLIGTLDLGLTAGFRNEQRNE